MRQVTQLYDLVLAPTGLRITQYSILSNLDRLGPDTMKALAVRLVMDRTTLTRNLAPLRAQGLLEVVPVHDRRLRQIRLTAAGEQCLREARPRWREAQQLFEGAYGELAAAELRSTLTRVVSSALAATTSSVGDTPARPLRRASPAAQR
jgi:DNA-binding MarR family transcriptional regulator